MPTNDLMQMHSGAKQALHELALSKDKERIKTVPKELHMKTKRKKPDHIRKQNNNHSTPSNYGPLPGPSGFSSSTKRSKKNKLNDTEDEFEERNNDILGYEPFTVKVVGSDRATYTLEIFMRDVISCLSRRDVARKTDPRAPVVFDKKRCAHAIIPANHKLMLYAKRVATKNCQRLKPRKFVLFKFYVDGTALSEGELYETSISNPDVHWAKAHIKTTQTVQDDQTVEHIGEANPSLGSFKVKIWTRLRETNVVEEFKATPEDDRSHERRKQRICIADCDEGGTEVTRYNKPVGGLVGNGPAQVEINICYDDLLGTRGRHIFEKEFSMNRLKLAGVTEAMFKDAYPNPVKKMDEMIILSDDSDGIDEALIATMVDDEKIVPKKLSDPKEEEELDEKKSENHKPIALSDGKQYLGHDQDSFIYDMKRLVNTNSTVLDKKDEEEPVFHSFTITLMTSCGNKTKLRVRPSSTIPTIIKRFLEERDVNPHCRSICCNTGNQAKDFRLYFDGDILPYSSTVTVGYSKIESGDVIDVHVVQRSSPFNDTSDCAD